LGTFLSLAPADDGEFESVQSLHETLLRGQFSLLPLSVRTWFWASPRARGIDARQKLQELLASRVSARKGCLFASAVTQGDSQDMAAHLLMFTSSLAVKSLASLLTAVVLNLFLYPAALPPLASRLRETPDLDEREALLMSIIKETERVSPPIVGCLRRAQRDVIIRDSVEDDSGVLVPEGWDIWLYFVGASRDPSAYPHKPDLFIPERFMDPTTPDGFAFGVGPKSCLGKYLVRDIIRIVAGTLLDSNITLSGTIEMTGVRGWLGWEEGVKADSWAKDMKQLPSQRPARGITLNVSRQ